MTHPANAFILMVGDDSVLLLPPVGKEKTAALAAPSHDETDAAPLLAALAKTPKAPVLILADIVAQDYKRESLPPLLSFFDRKKLLARKLAQAFPKTDLKIALDGADGSALFIGVEEKSNVTLWLDRLAPLRNPSGEVSLLPVECAGMLAKLAPVAMQGWGLLLLAHKTGGYRQIVTKNGEIVFTRLTPPLPALASPDTIAETLAQDIQATRAYLSRTGLTEDAPLHLAAILPPPLHQSFTAQNLPVSSRLLFSPREAAARLELTLPPQPDEPACDLVPMLWLQAQTVAQTTLLRPQERAQRLTALIRQAGLIAASFMTVLALSVAASEGLSLWQNDQEAAALRQDVAALESEFEAARHTLAREAEPLNRLRKAIERRRLFSLRNEGPESLIPLIDAVMGPEARAVAMEWKDGTLTLDLRLKDERFIGRLDVVARQEVTRRFDDLLLLMRETLKGYTVSITRYPYPTLPNEVLTNKNQQAKPPLPIATFLIRKEAP